MEVIEDLQICLPVKFHDFSPDGLREMNFLSQLLFSDENLDRAGSSRI